MMAATTATNFSAASIASGDVKVGLVPKMKSSGLQMKSTHDFRDFSGLKAAASLTCESESSFLGKDGVIALRNSFQTKAVKENIQSLASLQPKIQASFKVAVLGAAGGIGQPLSLLVKMSPLVSTLHLYDIANVKGVAADLSHCNTPSEALAFTGPEQLGDALKGVDVVVIPAGVPRKPGMTRDDLFNINAGIVKTLVEAVADNCPDAFIHIISNPVNSTVPIAAEVLKQKGVYNPKKLFGVTTLDVVRANTFVAQKKNLKLIDVDVPVIGGHAGITILPLLSKTKPSASFTDEEIEELTVRIQNAGTEVVEAKAGAGSATLSMAYAAARFVESSLRALDGDSDVYECSFVQSELTDLPFFASRIKLGKNGVEAFLNSDLQGLTDYESKALEALKPELRASIEFTLPSTRHSARPILNTPMAAWPASLRISPNQIAHNQLIYKNYQLYNSQFSATTNHPFRRFRLPSSHLGIVRLSNQAQSLINFTTPIMEVPLLSCEEAIERLRLSRERHKGKQQFLAMYSSIFGGITTDPAAMVIPMDDHMVHRGHGIFDTATIVEGHLYELDQHLDRCVRSASMAKISLPFDRETMRSILIQTVSASKCRNGSLRYWLSAGHGDFHLSPSGCAESTFYAIVTQSSTSSDHTGIKVITSSIPIKPPVFATMKSVNYLPNALCQMEAEENGCFASIWLDSEGFVAEGPNMNVAFVTYDKELMMPRFDKILSGCTAKRVLKLSQELVKKGDIRGVSTRDVTVEEGKNAEEMMLFGSGVLVRPIVQWDDQVIGNGNEGPVARALLELLLQDMKSGPSTVRTPIPY